MTANASRPVDPSPASGARGSHAAGRPAGATVATGAPAGPRAAVRTGPIPMVRRRDRPAIAVVEGFVASIMVLAGSFGTGWISNASTLNQHPAVIALRIDSSGVYVSTVLLTVGAVLLIRAWLRLGQRLADWGGNARRWVVAAVLAWSAPLLVSVPIFSRDVYAYIGQGRLVVEEQNPYEVGISVLENWYSLGTDPEWAEARTPYGPYFLWIARWVVQVSGLDPALSVLLFRLVAFAGVLLCVVYLPRLAELQGVNGAQALWIAVANPLFLISFVASAHNDALMVGLAVAGAWFAAARHPILGVLLVTASIGIKPITVVLLPFLGLLWAGPGASWPRKLLLWGATAGLSFGVLVLSGIPYGLGTGWIRAILEPTPGYTGYAPSGFAGRRIEFLGDAVGLPGEDLAGLFRSGLTVLSVLVVLVLMFRGSDRRVVRRMALGFTAIVLLAPIIQPWYILWILPFLAAAGIRDNWQIRVVYVVTTFFVIYGAQDQLSVWPFVELPLDASRLALVVALVFTFYLLFLDVHTRRLIFHGAGRFGFAQRSPRAQRSPGAHVSPAVRDPDRRPAGHGPGRGPGP